MPADLDKIRALLASVAGFTEGPWTPYKWSLGSAELVASKIAQVARNSGGSDLHAAIKQIGDAEWIYPAFTGNGPTSGPNAALIAAAPDLHRELTEAAGEIERLRLVVGWAETDALGTSNALVLVTEQAKKDCAERDAEIERLRAHNARMVAQINALADACDLAQKADYEEEDAAEPLFEAMVGPKGGDWPEIRDALRRLAAGEVDDG